jgi:hypothetical protein
LITGWFALVNDDGQTAGYFTTMQEVAHAQIPYFLTRDALTGFPAPNSVPVPATCVGSDSSGRVVVPAGSAVKMLGLYEDVSSLIFNSSKSKVKSRPVSSLPGILNPLDSFTSPIASNGSTPPARYVKCMAFANDRLACNLILFVPVTQIGR